MGCSDDPLPNAAGDASQNTYDARGDSTWPDPGRPEGGGCTQLDPSGNASIGYALVDGGAPEIKGGTLEPGTYQLTARAFYLKQGAPTLPPATRKGILRVTDTGFTYNVDPDPDFSGSITVGYTVAGTNLMAVPTCFASPDGGTQPVLSDSGTFPITALPFTATLSGITMLGRKSVSLKTGSDGGLTQTTTAEEYYTFTR